MRITFYSNYMNHHQEELSKALFKLTDGECRFVACEPFNEKRLAIGYEDMNQKYDFVLRPYEDATQKEEAMRLATESDVVIFGSGDEIYFKKRMEENRLTFRYLERPFKKGTYRRFIPMTRKKIYNGFTKYKDKNLYVLCSSAYTASDLHLCGFPAEKCFKWGYFPKVLEYESIEDLVNEKTPGSLLWVGRFLNWKHPEAAVKTAEYLRDKGKKFHLTMVGDGKEMPRIKKMIRAKKLEEYITLTGSIPADKVCTYMEKAEIFLFTSDFNEGWGVVLNEAMNSGCACVASHAIGSAPFLIEEDKNGLLYKNGDINMLCQKVEMLLINIEKRRKMGKKAYETVYTEWNPANAAKRLFDLILALSKGDVVTTKTNEPCTYAKKIKNDWYGGEKWM